MVFALQAWLPGKVAAINAASIDIYVEHGSASSLVSVPIPDSAAPASRTKPKDSVAILPRAANELSAHRSSSIGVNNMDELVYLHAASVLNNVQKRFAADIVYTFTG